jgi:glutamate 5-kinase
VRRVEGRFGAGDAVRVVDEGGEEFARGLSAYDADEVTRIVGKKMDELEATLGYRSVDEVIHRDDLVLL